VLDSWMGRGQKGSDGHDKVGLGSIRRPVIGLALGGGAARGFAHIGIIRTLVAHGIIPNVVVGTSIGAVVGGAYASGHLDTLEEWARSLQPRNILGYLDIRLNGSGLIGGAKLPPSSRRDGPEPDRGPAGEIRHRCDRSPHRPRDLADPWPHGRRDARLLRAARNILAGLVGDRWLVDGALVNPVPVSAARASARRSSSPPISPATSSPTPTTIYSHGPAADVSVSVDAGAVPEPEPPKRGIGKFFSAERTMKREFFGGGGRPGISTVMVDAFNIMQDRITRARLAGDPPDLLISPRVGQIGWFDFHRADDLIATARAPPNAPSNRSRRRSTFWRRGQGEPRRKGREGIQVGQTCVAPSKVQPALRRERITLRRS
jgi:NTE family protein